MFPYMTYIKTASALYNTVSKPAIEIKITAPIENCVYFAT